MATGKSLPIAPGLTPVRKKRLIKGARFAVLAAPWALLLALIIRLTIRDQWWLSAPIFYASPQPLQGVGWLVVAVIAALQRRIFRGLAFACVAVGILCFWINEDYRSNRPPSSAHADLTVLFWNTAYCEHPSAALIDLIQDYHPDVVALVEFGKTTESIAKKYEAKLPGYQVSREFGMAMCCFVRGSSSVSVNVVDRQRLPNRSGFIRVRHAAGKTDFDLVIVDIGPNAFYPRGKRLATILAEVSAQPGRPTIVAGDFNTPWDSVFFDPWRQKLIHADNTSGSGFRETWRSGLPILAIDHVWTTQHFRPLETTKIYRTGTSDHAALIVKIAQR